MKHVVNRSKSFKHLNFEVWTCTCGKMISADEEDIRERWQQHEEEAAEEGEASAARLQDALSS